MIKKKEKIIVTFPTTNSAMTMEEKCKEKGIDGRLIPLPSEISAGCGLAWAQEPSEYDRLVEQIEADGMEISGIYKMMI